MPRNSWILFPGLLAACWLVPVTVALAGEVYVDTQLGDDTFNGRAPKLINENTGPVRTLQRGLQRVESGDTLILVNRGEVFTGEISMAGSRFSGVLGKAFVLEGNGVVLDGSRPIPAAAWVKVKPDLWKFTPMRKGTYLLLVDGKPAPEVPCPPGAAEIPELAVGRWCAWHGAIFFRVTTDPFKTPRDMPMSYAAEGTGITLLDTQDVVIRNLTVRYYRQDGVNVHDRSRNVILENVTLEANGRSGLSASGNSLVGLKGCTLVNNRVAQLLITERAQVELLKTKLGDAPGRPFSISGGHLLIDEQEVFAPKK